MHIPVAPKCNIQCNYCNRKFDCCNESRPGVTSEILTPRQASDKIAYVKEKIDNLRVIGIAGPGDPLANESTFESLEIIRKEHPELTLCVSTNGLALPDCAERLFSLGVKFITVTMNACDPSVGSQIYSKIVHEGKTLSGIDGASVLIDRQTDGIRKCVQLGMVVKVNIVMIPEINAEHIPELVRFVKGLGAYIVNILPLIPVEGTAFAELRAPTVLERRKLMDDCSIDARMMRHCKQCRADAIGLIGEDRSQEFVHLGGYSGASNGCGPSDYNLTAPIQISDEKLIAVASSDGKTVDSGFGNSSCFRIYSYIEGKIQHIEDRPIVLDQTIVGSEHRKHIESIVNSIEGCKMIIVKEIGPLPQKVLANLGIDVVISHSSIEDAIRTSMDC